MKNQNKQIKILLVEDHPLVRIGIRSELNKNKDFVISAEASTSQQGIKEAIRLKPDVILLDIGMPDINGLEVTKILVDKIPDTKIIALTMHNNRHYIDEMIKSGARGYVLKDSPPSELFHAIKEVMNGRKFLCAGAKKVIRISSDERKKYLSGNVELTRREKEILISLAGGLKNKEIADKLFLSVRTIESHRLNIMKKLKLSTIAHLTKYALVNKLIDL